MSDDLQRLLERATRAPWWVERPSGRDAFLAYGTQGDLSETYDLMEAYNVDEDYELICALRNAVPALLARLAAAEAALEAQRGLVEAALKYIEQFDENRRRLEQSYLQMPGPDEWASWSGELFAVHMTLERAARAYRAAQEARNAK